MIREVPLTKFKDVLEIVNDSAQAYKGIIPSDCWKDPYMLQSELEEEIKLGVKFYGIYENDLLVAVMGIQPVQDVTLIRHAYVRTSYQRRGFGEKLLRHLIELAGASEVLVGTWKAAWWAVRFYEKNGFKLVSLEGQTRSRLRKYWAIPDRQALTSVVLRLDK